MPILHSLHISLHAQWALILNHTAQNRGSALSNCLLFVLGGLKTGTECSGYKLTKHDNKIEFQTTS